MDVRIYRAATMQEALSLVRQELGPDAAILHTREVRGGFLGRLLGRRQIEVTASIDVNVPSRLTNPARRPVITSVGRDDESDAATGTEIYYHSGRDSAVCDDEGNDFGIDPGWDSGSEYVPATMQKRCGKNGGVRKFDPESHVMTDPRWKTKIEPAAHDPVSDLHEMLRKLSAHPERGRPGGGTSDLCFRLFTDLLDAEIPEDAARQLIEQVRSELKSGQLSDELVMRSRILRRIESEIRCSGAIRVGHGERRMVALIGPTGVGKTTTIAKLAANYRLREHRSVGLITVDTYRIAAVEQIRTYAEIIDLPMQVVSSPAEMDEAVRRMQNLDLILLDTAGRSPRDAQRIDELRDYLSCAKADEVHLVLSTTASTRSLQQTVEQFGQVHPTHLLLTKLDEATGLGGIWPLIRHGLPISYLTSGQNVPDDIETAESPQLARSILGIADPADRRTNLDIQG